MNTHILTSFLLACLSFQTLGNTITLKVIDKTTKEPLPYTTVYLVNARHATATNLNGTVHLNKGKHPSDTIQCSFIGYETVEHGFNWESSNTEITIRLKPSKIETPVVIVTYRESLTAEEIVKTVIKNIPKNYNIETTKLQGFYREIIEENRCATQLNEASVRIQMMPVVSKPKKKGWHKQFIDDRYVFEHNGIAFNNITTPFIYPNHIINLIQKRVSNDFGQNYTGTLPSGPHHLLLNDPVQFRQNFLDPKLFKKYSYQRKGKETINGVVCHVIQFYPSEQPNRVLLWRDRTPKRAIFAGRMYIDEETSAVVKVKYQLAQNLDYQFYQPNMPVSSTLEFNYHFVNNKWQLKNAVEERIRSRARVMKHAYNKKIKAYRYLYLNPMHDSVRYNFNEKENWHHNIYTNLRFKDMEYDEAYWTAFEKNEIYKPLENEITACLEQKLPLKEQFRLNSNEKQELPEPGLTPKPIVFNYPFDTLKDDYHWVSDKNKRAALSQYLKSENQYYRNELIENKTVRNKIYKGVRKFYKKDDVEVRLRKPGELMVKEDTNEHQILHEFIDSVNKIQLLDVTEFEEQNGVWAQFVDGDSTHLVAFTSKDAFATSKTYILNKRDLKFIDSVENAPAALYQSGCLFTRSDKSKRQYQLYFRNLTTKKDSLLYEITDNRFDLYLSKWDSMFILTISSLDESYHFQIKTDTDLQLQPVTKLKANVHYQVVPYKNELYRITNENAAKGKIEKRFESGWKTIIEEDKQKVLTNLIVTEHHIIAKAYENAKSVVLYREKSESKWKSIQFEEAFHDVGIMKHKEHELLISYTSPKNPGTYYTFNLIDEKLSKVHELPLTDPNFRVFSSYINSKLDWVKTDDGTKIPITIIKSKHPDKEHSGVILKGYGAYGAFPDYGFSEMDYTLLKNGFTIVHAHVRGGGVLGTQWYQDGKLMQKKNTFSDFIACAEHLIEKGITTSEYLVAYGISAGGLTMSAAVNERPDLFNTVILDFPFVDVVTSMMNDTLPLTTGEYNEWGNPKEPMTYEYVKSYSPYQNIKSQKYPNLIFRTGFNDFQVPAWQVAKFVAKVRMHNTSNSSILLTTNFDGAHGYRNKKIRNKEDAQLYALVYGFLFNQEAENAR